MLGAQPKARLVGTTTELRLVNAEGVDQGALPGDNPYDAIRRYMKQFTSPPERDESYHLPRFSGGLVGYFGYDVVRIDEQLPDVPNDHLHLPDIHLMHCDTVLVFDHSFNQLYMITHVDMTADRTFDAAWDEAQVTLDNLQSLLAQPLDLPPVEVLSSNAGQPDDAAR